MLNLIVVIVSIVLFFPNALFAAENDNGVEGEGYGYNLEASTIDALCYISNFVKTAVKITKLPASSVDGLNSLPKQMSDQHSMLILGNVAVSCNSKLVEYQLPDAKEKITSYQTQNRIEYEAENCSLNLVASQEDVNFTESGSPNVYSVAPSNHYMFSDVTPIAKSRCTLSMVDKEIQQHGITSISRKIETIQDDITIATRMTYNKI